MRAVQMTPAQQRAQDASVRNLEHVMREAEAYLSARADAAESTREALPVRHRAALVPVPAAAGETRRA